MVELWDMVDEIHQHAGSSDPCTGCQWHHTFMEQREIDPQQTFEKWCECRVPDARECPVISLLDEDGLIVVH